MAVPNIRAPLSFLSGSFGGVAAIRVPLSALGVVTAGNPAIRGSLDMLRPVTGGNPTVRVCLSVLQAVIPEPPELPVATDVYPTLVGLGFVVKKTPQFSNVVLTAPNLRDTSLAYATYPWWNFELTYDYLPDGAPWSSNADIRTLAGFWGRQAGQANLWLFHDVDDYHVVGGPIATADGVTLQWPFVSQVLGLPLAPVGQIDLSSLATFAAAAVNVGSNSINIPNHGFTTGQFPPMFISNTGGSLPGGTAASTPYWPIVVDANNIKLANSEANALSNTPITITSTGSGTDTLSKGYAIYDNGTIVNPGSASLTLPNQVVFGSAPTSGHAITADFDYYFVCRFKGDTADFEKIMYRLYQIGKIDFRSVIQ